MVLLDYSDEAVGNALKMALGIKSVPWQRSEGLASSMASSAAIQTGDVTILGEPACIILLEDTIAEPSLFPNGNRGMPMALAHWRDNISTMSDSRSLKAHAALVLRQIDDGRDYLQGPNPSLADVNSAAWIFETGLENEEETSPILKAWCQRMRTFLKPLDTGNLVIPFLEDAPHIAAALEEFGSGHGNLPLSLTGQSDMLIYGTLDDESRIITSPLSHKLSLQ